MKFNSSLNCVPDTLIHTTATMFTPSIIGGLSRSDHPTRNLNRDGPYPFYYVPGWKIFFASDSPHYQRATHLATRTSLVGNGAVFTFGTPDTYPTILNQWSPTGQHTRPATPSSSKPAHRT